VQSGGEGAIVTFLTVDQDFVELTTKGEESRDGVVDVELYPYARHPKAME